MIKIYEKETRYSWNDKNQDWDVNITEDVLPDIKGATLLFLNEANKYLIQSDRAYNKRWWLCSPYRYSIYVYSIYYDGDFFYSTYVSSKDCCVRPALIISNLESSNLEIGDTFEINGYEFKIISDTLAWMYKQDIGETCFNENAEDGNNYKTSDIKKYVDNWFNTEIKPYL